MIRIRSRVLLSAPLLLLLASGGRLAAQEQAQQQTQKFQGEIQVREIGLVVEPPESGSFKPADLLVFDGGAPRQVIKAEPLRPEAGARPWQIVLYFDRVLAAPETARGAALALARQARELTGLGTVEVVVADPEPSATPATDAAALSTSLGFIAEQEAKKIGFKAERELGQPVKPAVEVATLRRQLDRLTAYLAGRPGKGARALFLVVDGFVPPPGEASLLSAPDTGDPAPPGTAAAALRDTSRYLSAAGWITFAMPYRDTTPDRERAALGDMERLRVQGGSGSSHTNSAPPVIPMVPHDRSPLRHENVADVFTRPDSPPLMALVQPTSGTVLGVDEQVRPAVAGLSRRWRIWYQAPEALDGKLHTVEVRLPSAPEPLRGQRWVQSVVPAEVDAARARLLAGGAKVDAGALKVDAALAGQRLRVRVAPAGAAAAGPVRLSIAFDNRSEARHVAVPETSFDKGWEHTVELQLPAGARRVSVVVEDLAHERWGGAAIDLSRAGK